MPVYAPQGGVLGSTQQDSGLLAAVAEDIKKGAEYGALDMMVPLSTIGKSGAKAAIPLMKKLKAFFNKPSKGKGVTFDYVRNLESSPNFGARYGQDIEPAGRYMTEKSPSAAKLPGFEQGTVTFENPLVLEWRGYGEDGWKSVLSKKFGGKKGKDLSKAINEAGHDGVVTYGKDKAGKEYSEEIVDLTMFGKPK